MAIILKHFSDIFPNKKVPLRQNAQTIVYYSMDQKQQVKTSKNNVIFRIFRTFPCWVANFWTQQNSAHVQIATKSIVSKFHHSITHFKHRLFREQVEPTSNNTIVGFTARLLTEANKTTVNLTAIPQDEEDGAGQLDLKLKAEVVDRTTPM